MAVILSEAKNLMDSTTYTSEILRLTPQNDVVGQSLEADFIFPLFALQTEANLTHYPAKANYSASTVGGFCSC